MKLELPQLKRCCFCLPLRYGLIACGYLRIVLLLLMFSTVIYSIVTYPKELTAFTIAVKTLFILLLIVDTCLTIVFLVGGHRKTVKLLHIYYIHSIVLVCLWALFFSWATVSDLYNHDSLSKLFGYNHFVHIIQVDIFMAVLFIGVQAYFILLLRSEIDKLKKDYNSKYDNLAVEKSLGN